MIQIQNVVKTYSPDKPNSFTALHGVSLNVEAGEFVTIMGVSGSGKSTLMNIIGCLDQLTLGSYRFDGELISEKSSADLVKIRRHKIGFVFQNFNLLPRYSALANVELPLIYQGIHAHERHQRARQVLEQVGLGNKTMSKPAMLSGGEQQRVAIARALITKPSIILADEPTGNLDSASGSQIMNILQTLNNQGVTIIVVTHDPNVAAQTKRTVHIIDGKIE
ncbi:MAG: ABC transporter ATP-binding protein [Candidatus Kerfeldbacteria bacterium]|nr:ABC transporter ATP-binding protein [Candidatus Kerfeldbacteria bacterium]